MNVESGYATFKLNLFYFADDRKLDFRCYYSCRKIFLLEYHQAYLQFGFSEDIASENHCYHWSHRSHILLCASCLGTWLEYRKVSFFLLGSFQMNKGNSHVSCVCGYIFVYWMIKREETPTNNKKKKVGWLGKEAEHTIQIINQKLNK